MSAGNRVKKSRREEALWPRCGFVILHLALSGKLLSVGLTVRNNMAMVFCRGCGKEIHETAITCPSCGAPQNVRTALVSATDKRILPAFLLCFFLGFLGVHRFYVGEMSSGIAQLRTLGV